MNKYEHLAKLSRREMFRLRSCAHKRAYETRDEALLNSGQDVYHCHFCKKWHRTAKIAKLLGFIRKVQRR